MANQAIALQARAPQGNFLAPAIQQGAQLINMMSQQRAAERQAAAQQQQLKIQQVQEDRAAALAVPQRAKAESEAGSAKVKYVSDFMDTSALALANVRDPQQAMAVGARLKQLFPEPEFQQSVDETIAYLTEDPAQFNARREESLTRTLDAKDQLANEFTTQNLGSSTRVLRTPKLGGGAGEVVPGSEVDLGQEVTYVRGGDGSVRAMPKRLPVGGGGGLVGGVRGGGAAGGVQMGQPIAGTGKPAAAVKQEKPLTQSQAKSTGYAMRAQEADEDLAAVKQYSPSAIASKRYAEDIPVLGALAGPLVNRALSENDQLVEQAQRNFINAVLRQDSGAAINAGEWANAQRQYFEQPNDKPAVIAQKAKNRATAIAALKVGAGAGMKQAPAADTKTPAGKRSTPTSTASGVKVSNW